MIKLLLLGVLVYIFFKLLKASIQSLGLGASGSSRINPGQDALDNVMIQDPVCGTYFARQDGVCRVIGGQEVCFCSQTCLEEYLEAR